MSHLKQGVSSYLDETSLHGFKYLSLGHGNMSRVYWLFVLMASISYACFSIMNALKDWEGYPVITRLNPSCHSDICLFITLQVSKRNTELKKN